MKLLTLLPGLCLLFFVACAQDQTSKSTKIAPLVQYESFEALAPLFSNESDTTYVINFWATWCKPCVEELPYFEQLHNTYHSKKVKVILVSLDFENQIDRKLIPFIEKHQLQSKVVALIDGDANRWIPMVSDEWSGAIPATLIRRNNQNAFYEQSFEDFEDLEKIVKPFVKS